MQLLEVALQGLEEGPYAGLVNAESLAKSLKWCEQAGSLFVAHDGDNVVGFLAATFLPSHMILGPVPCAMELAWYVLPDYRHRGHGLKLLNEFEAWAKEKGCKHIFLGKRRRGYQPLETLHWKTL